MYLSRFRPYIKILLIVFLFQGELIAQSLVEETTKKYLNYRQPLRENVHLHLNKTTFFKNELIWFTAYVHDQNNQIPSLNTKNLYVAVYNKAGEEMTKKMIRIENGIGTGQIELDSTFTASHYSIRAATNWMRNFEDSKPFEQRITILGEVVPKPEPLDLDNLLVDFYPEGGKLVKGLENNLGFWIRDKKGNGIALNNIDLITEDGNTLLTNLSTNANGHGQVRFIPGINQKYFLNAALVNGKKIYKEIPKAESLGLNIQLNNTKRATLLGSLKVNPETYTELSGQVFYLAIYKNTLLRLEEIVIDSLDIPLRIDKNILPFGVNTITIFDQRMRPVLRRMFFNENGKQEKILDLEWDTELSANSDSLNVKLNTTSKPDSTLSLSISALPFQSRNYLPQNTLISSTHLTPYLSNTVAFPGNFLKEMDRQSLFDLDLLLLIQGWGAYDWNGLFNGSWEFTHPFENGIDIEGRIIDADLNIEKQIWGITHSSKYSMIIPLGRDKTFSSNELLYAGDTLMISLMGKKGVLRLPKAELKVMELPGWDLPIDKKGIEYLYLDHLRGNNLSIEDSSLEEPLNLNLSDRTILLDEVELTARRKVEKEIPLNSAIMSARRILEDDIKKNNTLAHYLRRLGYQPRVVEGSLVILSRTLEPGPVPTRVPVPVYLDGMIAEGSQILDLPLSRVRNISYDNAGRKFISLVMRTDDFYYENRKRYARFLIEQGYARPQQYYNPGYLDYTSKEFKYFGAVEWLPVLTISPGTSVEFTIPTLQQDKILLHVEGMGSDGTTVSQSIELEIPQE